MSLFIYFLKILFIFSERGREGETRGEKTSMCGYLLGPSPGTWPATQACALTGNHTSDALISRLTLNPLSYISQAKNFL